MASVWLDPKVIGSLIALVGISVAALLSSFGYFYKVKEDQKRTTKHVLYYLLEIRHSLRTQLFDSKKVVDDYMSHSKEYVKSKGISDGDSEHLPKIKMTLELHLNQLLSSIQTEIDEHYLAPFNAALVELAKDRPVLAYSLSGKEALNKLIQANKQYSAYVQSIDVFSKDEIDSGEVTNEFAKQQHDAIKLIIEYLDKDIRTVSKCCDRKADKECEDILSRCIEMNINFEELGLNVVLDGIIERCIERSKEK